MPEFFQSQSLLLQGHHNLLMTVVFQLSECRLGSDNLHLADLMKLKKKVTISLDSFIIKYCRFLGNICEEQLPSIDCQPITGPLSANCWSFFGCLFTDSLPKCLLRIQPTVGPQSANCW